VTAAPLPGLATAAAGFAWGWLEDETLFSWCARFHRCCPWPARVTARELFGASGAVKARTAPAGIDHFVRATNGMLGDAVAILKTRTVTGLYAALAAGQNVTSGQMSCGTQKYGSLTEPRYCANCLREHRKIHGCGLWRMDHQLPGVAVCTDHGEPLHWVRQARFAWHLPEDLPASPPHFACTAEIQSQFMASKVINGLFYSAGADVRALIRTCLALLCEHYRVLDGKRLDPARLEADWARSHLGRWVAREAPALRCCRPGWIADMLRGRRSERNPVRWAYLAAFLKELGVTEPDDLFAKQRSPDGQIGLWGSECGVSGAVLEAFACSSSLAEAARSLNVAACTVRRWARSKPALQHAVLAWEASRRPPAAFAAISNPGASNRLCDQA